MTKRILCDDDYLGYPYLEPPSYMNMYDPRNDPTLVFVGYEDDQPVWEKKEAHEKS